MSNSVKAEAQSQSRTFTYDSVKYTISDSLDWDLDVTESLEAGNYLLAIKGILGPAQWAKFTSKRRTNRDLNALLEKATAAIGIAGN